MFPDYSLFYAYYACAAPIFYCENPPTSQRNQQLKEQSIKHEATSEVEFSSDEEVSSTSSSFKVSQVQRRKNGRRRPNDTKNIPKNYGRAIMNFILQQRQTLQRILKRFPEVKTENFLKEIERKRTSINSIADLRQLWLPKTSYAAICRIMSRLFLQRHCLSHIYNSRILNHSNHIKYRYRMLEAVARPVDFNSIKEY